MSGAEFRVAVGETSTSAWHEPAASVAAADEGARATLVFAHGAGTDMRHATLEAITAQLVTRGIEVVRFNFLYREGGRRVPDRMPRLAECYRAVVAAVRERVSPRVLLLGGHSMGGRVASHLAADGEACDGLVLCGYPLHPAGKPESLRDAHLADIRVPVLCMNGTRDRLCTRELMERVLERIGESWTQHWLEHADHGYAVRKRDGRSREDVFREMGDATAAWIDDHLR